MIVESEFWRQVNASSRLTRLCLVLAALTGAPCPAISRCHDVTLYGHQQSDQQGSPSLQSSLRPGHYRPVAPRRIRRVKAASRIVDGRLEMAVGHLLGIGVC
jgi:hypothetical protein